MASIRIAEQLPGVWAKVAAMSSPTMPLAAFALPAVNAEGAIEPDRIRGKVNPLSTRRLAGSRPPTGVVWVLSGHPPARAPPEVSTGGNLYKIPSLCILT